MLAAILFLLLLSEIRLSGESEIWYQDEKNIELAKLISTFQSEEEFFRLFNLVSPDSPSSHGIYFADRFGGAERSNAIKPKPAACEPELQVVPVKENPDPAAIYFPNCIRIKRCGGCCNHELLTCRSTYSENRNYEIHVSKLAERISYKEIVPLEEHVRCACDCKIQEEDCSEKQIYNKDGCRCDCKNEDEENKCRQNERKYWDLKNCSCHCRNVMECSTGSYFDYNSCSCKNMPISGWFSDKRINYNPKQYETPRESSPVIFTLDANDPRRKHKDDPVYHN